MKKETLINKIKLASMASLAAGALLLSAPAQASDCGGCAALHAANETVKKSDARDVSTVANAIDQATQAIAKLPRAKKEKLTPGQIRELVSLLHEADSRDMITVMEDNVGLLLANKSEIAAEVKRLPADAARSLYDSLDSVYTSDAGGNDIIPSAPHAPKTKPAKK